MCGIAGCLHRRGRADPSVVEAQLRLLDHRGPDSWGIHADGNAAIGQTRLAIIDLRTGDPPITTEDGSYGGVLNGEIYNYAALRDELGRQGHRLHTTGDTEVIPHLAERLEPTELASRLDGMFAFAVWDRPRQRLVLGRDRLGKKPLYWWLGPDCLVFASEIKSVLAHPAVTSRLDEGAIDAYLRFGYVPTPRTMYDGIRSLPPGHVLVAGPDLQVDIRPYWEPRAAGTHGVTPLDVGLPEAARLVRSGLQAAVERRLVADVPLGAFLSGGVDSSAVVALMARATDRPVRTFTIGFEDADGFDERPWARSVAQRYGTDHTEFVVSPGAVDLVERLVWHHDQPFGDSSAVPTYLLSELTKRHVTVALAGDGGDELFAGYERFAASVWAGRAARLPDLALRTAGAAARVARQPKVDRFLGVAGRGLPGSLLEWISYVPESLANELRPGRDRWGERDYEAIWASTRGASTLDRLLVLNLRTYLLDDLLPKVDRMGMAHGLEVRSPFLDHELVELALRLPAATKQRGMALKRVLKHAVADLLPADLVNRPKHGFGVPLDRWFREDLSAYVDATLGAPDARLRAHVDPAVLDRLIGEHRRGGRTHGHALWTLLTLEVFLRQRGW
jgi:asparagine synthase (glutamine-hydrolysing)